MTRRLGLFSVVCLLLLVAVGHYNWKESSLQAAPPVQPAGEPKPVEPDYHEFMEYVFQPVFQRLKPAMASAPTDNQGWKVVKSDSLILAESGNLLLIRTPQEDAADWVKHSVQVRDLGGQLYRAAQAKDFTMARKHYEAMVQNCNACHEQFAGGEHILMP